MNCQPGDLALVVSARRTIEAIGRFVIVERAAVPGEVLYRVEGQPAHVPRRLPSPAWIVRAANGGTLPCLGSDGVLREAPVRCLADRDLRPFPEYDNWREIATGYEPSVHQARAGAGFNSVLSARPGTGLSPELSDGFGAGLDGAIDRLFDLLFNARARKARAMKARHAGPGHAGPRP